MSKLKYSISILLLITGLFSACTDAPYIEQFKILDSTNFYLHYADTTVVIKWAKNGAIKVTKPDSLYVIPNYPYVVALDTIIGIDDTGASITGIYKKTTVDPKNIFTSGVLTTRAGQITLNNGTSLFKTGNYEIYVGLLTENGFLKFRNKPIKMKIVP